MLRPIDLKKFLAKLLNTVLSPFARHTAIVKILEATEDDNGWAGLGPVGSYISNKTSFDTRNYGFQNLSSLVKTIDLFEIKRDSGNSYLVRDVRKKKI